MQLRRLLSVALTVSAVASSAAIAQPLNVPKFFSMTQRPISIPPPNPSDTMGEITTMPYVDLKYAHSHTPELAAQEFSQKLKQQVDAGFILPDRISIFLFGFGWDDAWADYQPQPPEDPDYYLNSMTRMFREEDRIIADTDFPESMRDPCYPDHPNPNQCPGFRQGRGYRHPFLINTRTDPNNPPPLKQWMNRFLDEYQSIQTNGNAHWAPGTLPDPQRFYIDTESYITLPGAIQGVWMLNHLRETAGPTNDYWNRLLPGDPLNRTLKQAYDQAIIDYGFPTEINDPNLGIDWQLSAADPRNRSILIWYYACCQRAENEIMQNCAYGPILERWPNTKVGNYGHSRIDGQTDSFGWIMDRDPADQAEIPTSRIATKEFPRSWMEPNNVGAFMWHQSSGRWLASSQWASGNVDQPFLYQLNLQQCLGQDYFNSPND